MSERKTVKRKFFISDFEEEQEFLSLYHADGWRLASLYGNRYMFERCEKQAVCYQIDFNPSFPGKLVKALQIQGNNFSGVTTKCRF